MKLYLLGTFRIIQQGKTSLLTGLHAALFGMLALHPETGYAMTRSRLAGTLWPDVEEERARHLLSTLLYRLRNALGNTADILEITSDTISLSDPWVDVTAFRDQLSKKTMEAWVAALNLYTGDLLEELEGYWLEGPRAELRELYLSAISRTCEELEASGDTEQALLLAHRWALADPLNETAFSATMRLYADVGRFSAVLGQYKLLKERLAEELGVEPLPETTALYQQIVQHRERLSKAAPKTPAPLIGRANERAEILSLLDRFEAGTGGLVLLEGDPGMGKTRLLEQISGDAKWRGITLAWGHATELSTPKPMAPLPEAMQEASAGPRLDQIKPHLTAQFRKLAAGFIPQLASQELPVPSRRGSAVSISISTALQKVLQLLANLGPMLLIFEDVHWADERFWDLIPTVTEVTKTHPVGVVLSFREGEIRHNPRTWEVVRQLDRDFSPVRITLNSFTKKESMALVQALDYKLTNTETNDIHKLGNGNPLVIKELLKSGSAASPSLEKMLDNRLNQLSLSERRAVEAAAVLGRSFTFGDWQSVLGKIPPVNRILWARFLSETESGYTFKHDLIRAYVYNALPEKRRKQWHGKAAKGFSRSGAHPRAIAWHYEKAEQWSEAIHFYRRGAERALQLEDILSARDDAVQAVRISQDHPPDELTELGVRLLQLQVRQTETWSSEYESEADQLQSLAEKARDKDMLRKVLLVKLSHHVSQGRLDDLLETSETAIQLAEEAGQPAEEIETLVQVASKIDSTVGDMEKVEEYSQRAVSLARKIPKRPGLLASGLFQLIVSKLRTRKLEEATELLQEAEYLITEHSELASMEPELLFYRAVRAQMVGAWEDARQMQNNLVKTHRETNNFSSLRAALFNSAHIANFIGQFEEAILYTQELIDYVQKNSAEADDYLMHYYTSLLAECYTMQGEMALAEETIEPVLAWLNEENEGRGAIYGWNVLGILRHYQGRHEESYYAYSRALSLARSLTALTSSPLLCHAEGAILTGREDEARKSFAMAKEKIGPNPPKGNSNVTYYYFVEYLITKNPEALENSTLR